MPLKSFYDSNIQMKKQIYGIFYYSIKSSYTASIPPTLLKLLILFIEFNFVSQNIYVNRVKRKPAIDYLLY